jgi:hypothetical protein
VISSVVVADVPSSIGEMATVAGESTDGAIPSPSRRSRADDGVDRIGPGSVVGRYVVLARLGAGGMGVALADARYDEAIAQAERALASRKAAGVPELLLAEANEVLARARWELGDDRSGARSRAVEVLEVYRLAGPDQKQAHVELAAWLDEHPAGP